MASISDDGAAGRRILFVDGGEVRRTIRLGKMSKRDAEAFKRHVEALLAARLSGQAVERGTAVWLGDLPDKMHHRLAAVGLVKGREAVTSPTVAEFQTAYLAERTADAKPATLLVMGQAARWLVRFLGDDKRLADVTPADADAYVVYLRDGRRAAATVHKWVRYAKQVFAVAVRREIITRNPFAAVRVSAQSGGHRRVYVSEADVHRVIEAAPDVQWKLMIALARFGGLRVPSEPLALTWGDVDFANRRFMVRAPKTAHHPGGGLRAVPMFPELAPLFQAVFDAAPEGSVHVITRYRHPAANLRTQFNRYVVAAGLTPWPKPWQNMRASRATDLADAYPGHVGAGWLGHTEKIANAFYRTVTDEHFRRATDPAEKPAQNPAQSVREMRCTPSQPQPPTLQKPPEIPLSAVGCDMVQSTILGRAGIEPATHGFSIHAPDRGSNCPDEACENARPDLACFLAFLRSETPDLACVVESWNLLPAVVQAAIVAMVRSSASRQGAAALPRSP